VKADALERVDVGAMLTDGEFDSRRAEVGAGESVDQSRTTALVRWRG
jgi:hypothetical protein